jgi:hypothetical protein
VVSNNVLHIHHSRRAPVVTADVRQGEIILKSRWHRAGFILGSTGAVLLTLFVRVMA